MPFGMMLAARLARGAFSVGESSGIEGLFSSQKSGKSLDVIRSTLFSDQPADPLDVSRSEFKAIKGLPGQDTLLSKSDSESLFGSESSSEVLSRKSSSDHSLLGETGSITSRSSDGSIKATGETDNKDSKKSDSKDSKKSDKNSTWKRLMKGVNEYYNPLSLDGRVLTLREIDQGSGQQSNSVDAATTRVIRGDSASMADFADGPNRQNNNNMLGMVALGYLMKSRDKAAKRELEEKDKFHEEFTKRIDEEATKLREKVSANTNATGHSESSRASGVTGHSESSRASGKQDLTRRRSTNRDGHSIE